MALIHVYKMRDIVETEHFLQGGIIGGPVGSGIYGLIGKTITFTTPAGSHTFVAHGDPSRDSLLLLFKDIKAQLEAAIAGLTVKQIDGRFAFVQSTPTTGVALAAAAQDAKSMLGFDANGVSAGKVYSASVASPPALIQVQVSSDNAHVLYTLEP